jgi:hypothetical protein
MAALARKPARKEKITAKQFARRARDIKPIAEGFGACIASNKITVDGSPVRFMYREAPHNDTDSGWRFLSGLETAAYMKKSSNHAFHDCNTIANHDRTIIPFLGEPIGSVFEKATPRSKFVRVTDWKPE